jgi:hypothetical protein
MTVVHEVRFFNAVHFMFLDVTNHAWMTVHVHVPRILVAVHRRKCLSRVIIEACCYSVGVF